MQEQFQIADPDRKCLFCGARVDHGFELSIGHADAWLTISSFVCQQGACLADLESILTAGKDAAAPSEPHVVILRRIPASHQPAEKPAERQALRSRRPQLVPRRSSADSGQAKDHGSR